MAARDKYGPVAGIMVRKRESEAPDDTLRYHPQLIQDIELELGGYLMNFMSHPFTVRKSVSIRELHIACHQSAKVRLASLNRLQDGR